MRVKRRTHFWDIPCSPSRPGVLGRPSRRPLKDSWTKWSAIAWRHKVGFSASGKLTAPRQRWGSWAQGGSAAAFVRTIRSRDPSTWLPPAILLERIAGPPVPLTEGQAQRDCRFPPHPSQRWAIRLVDGREHATSERAHLRTGVSLARSLPQPPRGR